MGLVGDSVGGATCVGGMGQQLSQRGSESGFDEPVCSVSIISTSFDVSGLAATVRLCDEIDFCALKTAAGEDALVALLGGTQHLLPLVGEKLNQMMRWKQRMAARWSPVEWRWIYQFEAAAIQVL
ncbi:hypothetical protein L1987_32610 [Smallanthus sonchifolius]|uniref:Uncharacterized protein n=1 Tax=Smallanthus sonchifolius TaxID=185202 RepID=A0ACB9HNI1_9ASTR|nr:hypothetical protein L1987_32610 [Smallanthus sonchifolius]